MQISIVLFIFKINNTTISVILSLRIIKNFIILLLKKLI